MTEKPTTRAEAAEAVQRIAEAESVIGDYTGPIQLPTIEAKLDTAEPFLSLNVRRVLYITGLAALVVAPTVGVNFPDYAEAITTAGNLLGAAALGTALANPSR